MVKRFSTVRDNQRGSQSYMKNVRGRKEIGVSTRREGRTQEERDRSTQLSVPKVFSVAQTHTKIHRIVMGREGERRKQRCSEVENRESKVGESNQHTPEQKWELNIGFLNVQNLYHILKNKDQKSSIEVRLLEIQYLKTKTQNLEIYMKFSLKIGLLSFFFFLQGYTAVKIKE